MQMCQCVWMERYVSNVIRFSWRFSGQCYMVFCLFLRCPWLNCAHSGMVCYYSAQVSGQSCPWPLKLMTSQRVERTWIRTGGYGRFRGERVNCLSNLFYLRRHIERNTCTIDFDRVRGGAFISYALLWFFLFCFVMFSYTKLFCL